MEWTFTGDLAQFPDAARSWLRLNPVLNTVPLTVLGRLHSGLRAEGALLGWLTVDDVVHGAILHTPPFPLLLGGIPVDSAPALADALRSRDLRGVNGPLAQAENFAASWRRPEAGRMAQRLYQLGTLLAAEAGGAARRATDADVELVVDWYTAFAQEAEPSSGDGDFRAQVTIRIAEGELVLWEADGRPVAMAAFSGPIAGMSRIGPVYTLPHARRTGYGAAVTHAASLAAQQAGADRLLLFTDLANPTSNSIYQAIGYHPVTDYVSIRF
jgi:GNAT superfamily N-acetyltransferase